MKIFTPFSGFKTIYTFKLENQAMGDCSKEVTPCVLVNLEIAKALMSMSEPVDPNLKMKSTQLVK